MYFASLLEYREMNRIVHVITGLGDGGAEAVLYRMVTSNKLAEEHIVISLLEKSKYGDPLENNKIRVYYMDIGLKLNIILKFYSLYLLLKELKPDVIQTWMYHSDFLGGILGRLSGCKNIVWGIYCTDFTFKGTKFLTILIIFINAFLSRVIPKKIISCSKEGIITHKQYGFDSTKLVYIPNGIPHETFTIDTNSNNDIRYELNIDKKDVILGIVGRYSPMKDHLNFIKALEKLSHKKKEFTAIFIGENLDENNKFLVNQLQEYNLIGKVRLLGKRSDVPKLMNLMDLKILSSSFGEGQPNVLCESMLSGTPCITTDVGDSKIIVDSHGWVVPPRDHERLCEQMLESIDLMVNESEWQKRILAGRDHIIKKFSIEAMTESYRSIWRL